MNNKVGAVIIGRNEGERLRNCIKSMKANVETLVYVDSGSTDGSVIFARDNSVDVVELDMELPFSAARARNAGFKLLINKNPQVEYIQFIDGDCKLDPEWIKKALDFFSDNSEYAIVAGRRKEINPESSIYNRMCDFEWDTPVGDTHACGGDFLARKSAFAEVNGFNPSVVAGEEPEMCYRLRNNNWKIFRLDAEMTFHDAAITRFSQWWMRTKRTGHAYLQGCMLHLSEKKGYYVKESLKDWIWAFIFPLFVLLSTISLTQFSLLFLLVYPIRLCRVLVKNLDKYRSFRDSLFYSFFLILSNFPQLSGQILYLKRKLKGKEIKIIEYSL